MKYRTFGAAILLALAGWVAGCASTQELAQHAPDETFNTSVKLATIRDCIVLPKSYAYQALPKGDGWQVSPIGADIANFSIDLTPTAQGTHVEVRRVKTLIHIGWDEDVAPCLDKLPRG